MLLEEDKTREIMEIYEDEIMESDEIMELMILFYFL